MKIMYPPTSTIRIGVFSLQTIQANVNKDVTDVTNDEMGLLVICRECMTELDPLCDEVWTQQMINRLEFLRVSVITEYRLYDPDSVEIDSKTSVQNTRRLVTRLGVHQIYRTKVLECTFLEA